MYYIFIIDSKVKGFIFYYHFLPDKSFMAVSIPHRLSIFRNIWAYFFYQVDFAHNPLIE